MKYIKQGSDIFEAGKQINKQTRLNEIQNEKQLLIDWRKTQKDQIDTQFQNRTQQLNDEQQELSQL